MKKLSNILLMAGVAFLATLTITSCQQEVPDTNPLNKQGVNLVAYGPNPVARGGYLRMMGTGLDQIQTVTIADQVIDSLELVSNEELKVLVPQDAQIGNLVLTTKGGDTITGRVKITYTEPVGFAEENPFEPATVKAGQTLTINGEYLNLVEKVIFDGAEVTEFAEQDRKYIKIENFPATAKTGTVTLSFVATGDTMAQEIPSEAKLEVVIPTVDLIEAKEVHANQVINVAGKDLDLVTAVLSTTGDSLIYEVADDAKLIAIRMPEVVMNGTVNLVTASGVQVPAILVGVALPKVTSVEGNTGVKEGSVITINGTDLAIVSGINFVDIKGTAVAAAADGLSVTDTKVTVTLPAAAVTGKFTILTTANINIDSTLFAIKTLKPEVTEFAPAEVNMGGTVALNGTNLDLVKSVTLTGGAELTPADASATTFNLTIPYANAETGKVTLTMKNGETLDTEAELTIKAPLCAYVIEWPELIDDEPIQAGTLLRLVVGNREKLTAVQIDGQDCGFLFNGEDVVFISTPESAGANSKVKLISEGLGEIEYDYAFKPNTEVTYVIWKGTHELPAGWGGPAFELKDTRCLIDLPLEEGDDIRIWLTPTADDWTLQMNTGMWKSLNADLFGLTIPDPQWPSNINSQNADISKGYVLLKPNAVAIDTLFKTLDWGNAMIVNGASAILSKIDVVKHISLEKTLAKGPFIATGWGNQPTVLNNGELAGAKAGQILRMYITPIDDGFWQLQLFPTDWSAAVCSFKKDEWDLSAHNGAIEIVLTDEIISKFQPGIILNGDLTQVDKITLE